MSDPTQPAQPERVDQPDQSDQPERSDQAAQPTQPQAANERTGSSAEQSEHTSWQQQSSQPWQYQGAQVSREQGPQGYPQAPYYGQQQPGGQQNWNGQQAWNAGQQQGWGGQPGYAGQQQSWGNQQQAWGGQQGFAGQSQQPQQQQQQQQPQPSQQPPVSQADWQNRQEQASRTVQPEPQRSNPAQPSTTQWGGNQYSFAPSSMQQGQQSQQGYGYGSSMTPAQQQGAKQSDFKAILASKPIIVWIASILALLFGAIDVILSLRGLFSIFSVVSEIGSSFISPMMWIGAILEPIAAIAMTGGAVMLLLRKGNVMLLVATAIMLALHVLSPVIDGIPLSYLTALGWFYKILVVAVLIAIIVLAVLPATRRWLASKTTGFEPRNQSDSGNSQQSSYNRQQPGSQYSPYQPGYGASQWSSGSYQSGQSGQPGQSGQGWSSQSR